MFCSYCKRSTNSILELAASILDLIMHFFPDKLDQLPKETSRVMPSCIQLQLQHKRVEQPGDLGMFRHGF